MESESIGASRREAMIRVLRLGGASAATAGLGLWLTERGKQPAPPPAPFVRKSFQVPSDPALPEMAVVQGGDPAALARRAILELGGIARFVSRGDVVVVKPNVAWDATPEQAADTNPQLVAEVCRLCRDVGARRVIVTDVCINDAPSCFANSGIGAAARAAGASVVLPEDRLFREVDLHGETLRAWPVLEPFLSADKVINLPVAKHHSLTGTTLGMKNWYGILGGARQRLHQRIDECLVDLAGFMRPTLTILDAWRVLVRNGPGGGNLADVELRKTVIAATDPVALDAYAAKAYWNLDAGDLPYLAMASERHLGTPDFATVRTRFASIS